MSNSIHNVRIELAAALATLAVTSGDKEDFHALMEQVEGMGDHIRTHQDQTALFHASAADAWAEENPAQRKSR